MKIHLLQVTYWDIDYGVKYIEDAYFNLEDAKKARDVLVENNQVARIITMNVKDSFQTHEYFHLRLGIYTTYPEDIKDWDFEEWYTLKESNMTTVNKVREKLLLTEMPDKYLGEFGDVSEFIEGYIPAHSEGLYEEIKKDLISVISNLWEYIENGGDWVNFNIQSKLDDINIKYDLSYASDL